MYETSGVLAGAVEAYLHGEAMTRGDIAAMRAYLRQWMDGPWADAGDLRERIDHITTRASLAAWLADAMELGIDPL